MKGGDSTVCAVLERVIVGVLVRPSDALLAWKPEVCRAVLQVRRLAIAPKEDRSRWMQHSGQREPVAHVEMAFHVEMACNWHGYAVADRRQSDICPRSRLTGAG